MNSIEIKHLSKHYKSGVTALEDITFSVKGGVFGLLGHNGAGKSTLMKAIVTILEQSAGTIHVCGYDTQKEGEQVRSSSNSGFPLSQTRIQRFTCFSPGRVI